MGGKRTGSLDSWFEPGLGHVLFTIPCQPTWLSQCHSLSGLVKCRKTVRVRKNYWRGYLGWDKIALGKIRNVSSQCMLTDQHRNWWLTCLHSGQTRNSNTAFRYLEVCRIWRENAKQLYEKRSKRGVLKQITGWYRKKGSGYQFLYA